MSADSRPTLPALSLLRPGMNSTRTQGDGIQSASSLHENTIASQLSVGATRYRFLTPSEWAIFADGVGGVKDGTNESQSPFRPSNSSWWPQRSMPQGLYRDIVTERVKCFYLFHMASIFRWGLIIAQIFIGAALTALGPFSFKSGTPVTVLGAINTIAAGLLALVHNSGLPDRFRHDMQEFDHVEDHVRQILEGRLVAAEDDLENILAECFDMFSAAKSTVNANQPSSYVSRKSQHNGQLADLSRASVLPQVASTAKAG